MVFNVVFNSYVRIMIQVRTGMSEWRVVMQMRERAGECEG